ncbi:Hemerythrin HHE cation binding domain protein [Thiocapsa sp. KS1]|nr:hemerythrin domain-containing protein [Thiocapsa sp. KS1]CRI64708.1 Hemerythrin HHE cation binding domain protein [Thiocapsa sp. KS1]
MMTAITDTFTEDHHRCDRLLAAAEASAGGSDWAAIGAAAAALSAAMECHFTLEEDIVFPALAQVFFVAENPIEIMCSEHAQMRQLLADLGEVVGARDKSGFLGILETLHFLVQQHNYKEEGIIYPMADGALPQRAAEMAAMVTDG